MAAAPARTGRLRFLGAAVLSVLASFGAGDAGAQPPAAAAGSVPIAVLGDSLGHSYQDAIAFPPGSGRRGGAFHARTFQWIEVLARLRGGVLDPGPWEADGQRRIVARAGQVLGWQGARAPRKEDYRYNLAHSGALCASLTEGATRQVQPLLHLMAQDAARWRRGVVVVRIGMVQMSTPDFLDGLALDPEAPAEMRVMDGCLAQVQQAVGWIRAAHPQTRIVLVGLFDDSNDPLNFGRWRSRAALDNIARGLDRYDAALRELAVRTPQASFFDDRAWFQALWGGRGAGGAPAYRTVRIGPLEVTNTMGDEPRHAVLVDDHWGLAANALWAQAISRHLAGAGVPVRPLDDAEVRRFVEAQLPAAAPGR
ncbi:MAG: hypothetical protein QM586_13675 [Xenophilus sp.]